MQLRLGVVSGCVTLAAMSSPLCGQDRWAQADAAVVRLAPEAFPDLPRPIVRDLDRRGCRIPQADVEGRAAPHNVIRGEFTTAGRPAWAVLCSVRDTSRILVYASDTGLATDSVGVGGDRLSLQEVEAGRIAYSRRISAVTAASIRARAGPADANSERPAIDHAGIEDAFLGKASVIHYRLPGGKWLLLPVGEDSTRPG